MTSALKPEKLASKNAGAPRAIFQNENCRFAAPLCSQTPFRVYLPQKEYAMKTKKGTTPRVDLLKAQLRDIRKAALEASRKGNSLEAARLSAEAIKLNRLILASEGLAAFA